MRCLMLQNLKLAANAIDDIGKSKVLENHAFNWDRLLSTAAVKFLDSGCLMPNPRLLKE